MSLVQLIKKRGSCKGKLTLFTKFITSIKVKKDITELDLFEIRERTAAIKECKLEFDQFQSDIEEIADDSDLDIQINERESFENTYFSYVALANKVICDNEYSPQVPPSESADSKLQVVSNQISSVRLPTIELPKYNGSYQKWLEFRDTFRSLIHEDVKLTGIQKFHYLRACLDGDAAPVIKSLELSEANYEVAWNALLERYDSNRLLIHNHVRELYSLEQVQKESASGLRKILDSVTKNLRALEQLKEPVQHWDTLLIYLVVSKLDNVTLRFWETYKSENRHPSFQDLKTFLKGRAEVLEAIAQNDSKFDVKRISSRSLLVTRDAQEVKCVVCGGKHTISTCDKFMKLNVNDRLSKVKYLHLCINCLKRGHYSKSCRSKTCAYCHEKHHVLLHGNRGKNSENGEFSQSPRKNDMVTGEPRNLSKNLETVVQNDANKENNSKSVESIALSACSGISQVFLSTVQVRVFDNEGRAHVARALLDNGAQSSFITTDLCKRLSLPTENITFSIRGLNQKYSEIRSKCKVRLEAIHGHYEANLQCFVLDIITGSLPQGRINPNELNIPLNIKLADPTFYKSGTVDMLIGADLYYDLIRIGMITLEKGPVLQKTRFGWVVAGPMNKSISEINCYFSQSTGGTDDAHDQKEIQASLQKFWQLEEIDAKTVWSEDEKACEEHFVKTTTRDSEGRFVVSLPFKAPVTKLGESLKGANKRFLSLKSKFAKKPKFKEMYIDFMREYAKLGHMEKVNVTGDELCYYLPHQGVLREDSLTTKLRVVFDGSAPTSSGFSLNHLLMNGPIIQQDLFSILLRFRQHKYVVSADITKMYRQVLVKPSQCCLQRILWGEDPEKELEVWELKTVTYGTTSASYLVIRCIFQLADENSVEHPELAQIIKSDFYVDDLLTGADNLDEAANICKGVTELLKKGCFELRKFCSNDKKVLRYVKDEYSYNQIIELGDQENTKILGIMWCPRSDILQYKITQSYDDTKVTKRIILSEISKIFDPLGLVCPCVIRVKILLQKLWLEKLSWDEPLPLQIKLKWKEFSSNLSSLNELRLERRVLCNQPTSIEMHGFCDASEVAYGGCIYVRSTNENGEVSVHLLCAKSKVAPLKTVSLPRLELLGAVILAKLTKKVQNSVRISFDKCILWSDSMVVLSWLRTEPCRLKAFVGNRVSEVQNLTEFDQWRHVSSKNNPADLLSRGVPPKEMLGLDIWWHGPQWLKENYTIWPKKKINLSSIPDVRKDSREILIAQAHVNVLTRFSDFNKLKRVFSWVFRFIENCKIKKKDERIIGSLSLREIKNAVFRFIKMSQCETFPNEIKKLRANKNLGKSCKFINLNPFIDDKGILRVGGRLAHAKFAFEKKHPVILSSDCTLATLVVRDFHVKLLHAGPRHVLTSIREEFWIVGGKRLCNKVINQCITCYRFKTNVITPIMAPLPELRLSPRYPFEVVGVDYAGPFMIKSKAGRGFRLSKAYICLFVCFTIKAVHLELVSELTKDAFLATMRRFVARRGKPKVIYSDNGTNFVSASHELRELGDFINTNGTELEMTVQKEGIEWKFIPPHSPHFGGLWEAGVKSVKYHLKRVMKNIHFTFEQFYTILVQVEAILNSRPLSALSDSPEDLIPLSPAHFLVGRQLTAVPENDVSTVPVNRLSLYQHMQQIVQHLWSRWSKEYVSDLQTRTKWLVNQAKLQKGALVLIKEDNQPPLRWRLGRVEEIHHGRDGVSRVATVRTQTGVIRRSLAKICPLPLEESEKKAS